MAVVHVQECRMSAPAALAQAAVANRSTASSTANTSSASGTDSAATAEYAAHMTCAECVADLVGTTGVCTHAVLNGLVEDVRGVSLLDIGLNWSRASALSHRRQAVGDVAHGLGRGGGYVALLPRSQGAAELVLAHLGAHRFCYTLMHSPVPSACAPLACLVGSAIYLIAGICWRLPMVMP